MATLLGVLVAGGRGERLGLSVPKALASVGGRSLLERALECLATLCDHVVVAAPAAMSLELARGNGGTRPRIERAHDSEDGAGPLAGVVAGLNAEDFDRAVVLGVDFPLMRPATLAALVAHLGVFGLPGRSGVREPDRPLAVVPAPGGRLQPLAAAYGSGAGAALGRAFSAGERSVSAAVAGLDPVTLGDDELAALPGGLESFFNLNTPADLLEAERRLAARGDR